VTVKVENCPFSYTVDEVSEIGCRGSDEHTKICGECKFLTNTRNEYPSISDKLRANRNPEEE